MKLRGSVGKATYMEYEGSLIRLQAHPENRDPITLRNWGNEVVSLLPGNYWVCEPGLFPMDGLTVVWSKKVRKGPVEKQVEAQMEAGMKEMRKKLGTETT